MSVTVSPILAGVVLTLAVEFIALVVFAIIKGKEQDIKEDDKSE